MSIKKEKLSGKKEHRRRDGRRDFFSGFAPIGGLFAFVLIVILIIGSASCNVEPQARAEVSPTLNIKGLSDDVSEVNISVSGPGIDQEESFSPSETRIVIPLPEADGVKFDVEAPLSNVGIGPVYSFGGIKTVDLKAGETTTIDILMAPFDTKILVPDMGNSQIVQLTSLDLPESLSSSDFEAELGNDGLVLDLSNDANINTPFDIAIDNSGRFWITHDTGSFVSMFENIEDTDPTNLSNISANALAFYSEESILYALGKNEPTLYRIPVNKDGTTGTVNNYDLTAEEINSVAPYGMAVDATGTVFFLDTEATLYKYDPNLSAGNRVVATYSDSSLISGGDLLLKNGNLYVTNPDSSGGKSILKLSTDLRKIGWYGTNTSTPENAGDFFGPKRFLATTRRNIFVTDMDQTSSRIVSFEDVEWSGWETYRPMITAVGSGDAFMFGLN